jgi:hypothetical protein
MRFALFALLLYKIFPFGQEVVSPRSSFEMTGGIIKQTALPDYPAGLFALYPIKKIISSQALVSV